MTQPATDMPVVVAVNPDTAGRDAVVTAAQASDLTNAKPVNHDAVDGAAMAEDAQAVDAPAVDAQALDAQAVDAQALATPVAAKSVAQDAGPAPVEAIAAEATPAEATSVATLPAATLPQLGLATTRPADSAGDGKTATMPATAMSIPVTLAEPFMPVNPRATAAVNSEPVAPVSVAPEPVASEIDIVSVVAAADPVAAPRTEAMPGDAMPVTAAAQAVVQAATQIAAQVTATQPRPSTSPAGARKPARPTLTLPQAVNKPVVRLAAKRPTAIAPVRDQPAAASVEPPVDTSQASALPTPPPPARVLSPTPEIDAEGDSDPDFIELYPDADDLAVDQPTVSRPPSHERNLAAANEDFVQSYTRDALATDPLDSDDDTATGEEALVMIGEDADNEDGEDGEDGAHRREVAQAYWKRKKRAGGGAGMMRRR